MPNMFKGNTTQPHFQ